MEVFFSKHAREQMLRRRINEEIVLMVVFQPDQIIYSNENPTMKIYQSIIKENDVMFLVRIFIDIDKQPNVIVTVYKTTKISKYYESEI